MRYLLLVASACAGLFSAIAHAEDATATVVVRVRADGDWFKDLTMFRLRIMLSEIDAATKTMRPFQAAPINVIDVKVSDKNAFDRKDEWAYFRIEGVQPGDYAVSYTRWEFRKDSAVVGSQSYVLADSWHFPIKAGVVNYLGDFKPKYEHIEQSAKKFMTSLGYDKAAVEDYLKGASPPVQLPVEEVHPVDIAIQCESVLKRMFSTSGRCGDVVGAGLNASEFPYFRCSEALKDRRTVCFGAH